MFSTREAGPAPGGRARHPEPVLGVVADIEKAPGWKRATLRELRESLAEGRVEVVLEGQ